MNQSILQLSNEIKDQSKKLEAKSSMKQELQSDLERNKDLYERKNLDLAKMLMAIDNLYSKCSEGTVRVKYNCEEFAEEVEPKNKKQKKAEEKARAKKEDDKKANDEESPMETKCKVAIQKLKSIISYTRDYQAIIQGCKERHPNASIFKK